MSIHVPARRPNNPSNFNPNQVLVFCGEPAEKWAEAVRKIRRAMQIPGMADPIITVAANIDVPRTPRVHVDTWAAYTHKPIREYGFTWTPAPLILMPSAKPGWWRRVEVFYDNDGEEESWDIVVSLDVDAVAKALRAFVVATMKPEP